jgi:hypothetical protein
MIASLKLLIDSLQFIYQQDLPGFSCKGKDLHLTGQQSGDLVNSDSVKRGMAFEHKNKKPSGFGFKLLFFQEITDSVHFFVGDTNDINVVVTS